MATTSMWKVESRMDHVIDYVMDENKTIELLQVLNYTTNEEKTMEHQYVTCLNCMQQNPLQSMLNTKKLFQDKKKIICFHGYQSFAEGEVTPKLAHQIGVELAEKLWGSRFEVVVTTHLNTDNIHNHIVLNATSCIDGKRYCNSKKDLYELRTVSDDLCRQYGLSVIEDKAYQSKTRMQYHREKTLESIVKKDVDEAIKVSMSFTSLSNQLRFEGYEVTITNKDIILQHHMHDKSFSLSSLGYNYSLESIKNRLLNQQIPSQIKCIYKEKGYDISPYIQLYKQKKLTGLQKLFIGYQYKLGILPRVNYKSPVYTKELKAALRQLDKLSDETILLCKNNIETLEQLNAFQEPLQVQLNDLMMKRLQCRNKIRRCTEDALKEELKQEAKSFTPSIKALRKCLELCEDIKTRSTRLQQFEIETQSKSEKGRTRS